MNWRSKALERLKVVMLGILTIFIAATASLLPGCGADSDSFFFGALGLNEGRIFVVNAVATPMSQTVSMYDLNGRFLGVALDTSSTNMQLRGLARNDGLHLIVSSDTPDQLNLLNVFSGTFTTYAQSSLFTGNIFDTVRAPDGSYFVVESNTIERFLNGTRVPVAGATPYVNTTLAPCTIATARGISVTADGDLVVVSNGNDDVLVYDISGASSASCITAYQGMAGTVNPMDVLGHTDGRIFVVGNGDDTLYVGDGTLSSGLTAVYSGVIIDNPVALGEMPDGTLLVGSDANDAIVHMETDGTVINAQFIKNGLTGTIAEILVVRPQ